MATKNVKSMNITVDTGYRRIPVFDIEGNEVGEFYFNPTDIGIIERYNRLAETFDAITEPLEAVKIDETNQDGVIDSQYLEAIEKAKERLYDAVNELFGGNAAGAFFGKVHPFSPVDGNFYCENVLQAVGQFISEQFDAETKKLSDRANKYLNRAQRRAKK